MSEELEVLKVVVQKLDSADIVYFISGSMAANYYTTPRMTRDIDVVIQLSDLDSEKFVDLFSQEFYVDQDSVKEEFQKRGMFNLIHKKYVVKIDFIIEKKTKFQASTFSRRQQVSVSGVSMWIISPEDLMVMKMLWAQDSFSELQLGDVRSMLRSVDSLDNDYIKLWVDELDLDRVYKKVVL